MGLALAAGRRQPHMTAHQDDRGRIRTPDQRLRCSSVRRWPNSQPSALRSRVSITALGLTPVMFELGARPHPPQELYRAYLAQSDIFIGLYWQRYGWVGPGMDISGLEDELQLSGSMPRLLYLKTPAPDREPRLSDDDCRVPDRGERLVPVVRHSARARPAGSGRSCAAVERTVLGWLRSRSSPTAQVATNDRGRRALAPGDVDVVDRARARHRRGVGSTRVARRAARHAHRSRWHRQDRLAIAVGGASR